MWGRTGTKINESKVGMIGTGKDHFGLGWRLYIPARRKERKRKYR